MSRSLVTIDLGAIRANAARLRAVAGGADLWAVVKADAYGHGATEVAPAALAGGATALCVATVGEGLAVRSTLPAARVIVLQEPVDDADFRRARDGRLEVCVSVPIDVDGLAVHLKLDTGMGRWGALDLADAGRGVVGCMTHLATADTNPAFVRAQLERFREATAGAGNGVTLHAANSAATLTVPEARFDAVRCGIALYGIDPFGVDASDHGLRPALRWESEVALVKCLAPGETVGYGRLFVVGGETWLGIVPVGYADGFPRALAGTEVLVAGERCPVIGAVSMDALAVRLPGPVEKGSPVTLVGDGVTLEAHAALAGTIAYELATAIRSLPPRAERVAIDTP